MLNANRRTKMGEAWEQTEFEKLGGVREYVLLFTEFMYSESELLVIKFEERVIGNRLCTDVKINICM